MLNTLVKHALANVWCTPFQDAQALIGLSRATAYGGARDYVSIQKQRIKLPTATERYHVYQIGQNNPGQFEIDIPQSEWFSLSEVCRKLKKIVELYTVAGETFCRNEAFIIYTQAKTFIIAVRLHKYTADLNLQTLYFRTYSNAFYDSVRSAGVVDAIKTNGRIVETIHQSVLLQNEYHAWKAKPEGYAYAFRNGRYVHDFTPNTVRAGDSVEYVYDAAIYRIVDLRLNDLPTFTSALDTKRKYLLHPPKYHGKIDYRDDLDFWVIHKAEDGGIDGVYYHKNAVDSVRMVSHNDYSLPVGIVQAYLDSNPNWDPERVFIRIHFRKSGYDRPLVFEHNRIHELYKLTDTEIVAAMIGLDATVPEWRAETLEASNYPRIMRSLRGQISGVEVYNAYGYNAVAALVAASPQQLTNGRTALPAAVMANATAFEYDQYGKLLDYRTHVFGEEYVAVNPLATMVEVVVGEGKEWFDYQEPTGPFTMDPLRTQHFYACRVVQGVRDNQWMDVTSDPNFVVIANGVATFTFDPDAFVIAVMGTGHFLCQTLELPITDNTIHFTMTHKEPNNHKVGWIPTGKLELWLNGSALIEDIDYYVQWPEVTIVNKVWLDTAAPTQKVVVRAQGLCNPDLTREVTQQIGYVLHQTLSINNKYDLRDDKVVKCVVAGRVLDRSKLEFAENPIALALPGIADGSPYSIDDLPIPVVGVKPYDVYWLRDQSRLVDQRVSDYLTNRLPEHDWTNVVPIPNRYPLVSPTVAVMLADLLEGQLVAPASGVDNNAIIALMEDYRRWLQVDPCVRGVNDNFAVVHPHPWPVVIEVTVEQYSLLERVISLYLYDKVSLTNFLAISTTVPVEPNVDPYWENVVYQLRFEGAPDSAQVIDDKEHLWVAKGGAKLVGTGDPAFGTMIQINTDPAITNTDFQDQVVTNDTALADLSGDFTVEFFLQTNQEAHDNAEVVLDTSSPEGTSGFQYPTGWVQFMLHWDRGIELYVGIEGLYYQTMISVEQCLVLGQLNHVAWVRKNGVSKLFVNGLNVTSTYINQDFPYQDGGIVDPHVYGPIQQWILGKWAPAGGNWPTRNVWMDNFRLTVGVARYESTFDPADIEYHIPT